jgi:hypothetical protein
MVSLDELAPVDLEPHLGSFFNLADRDPHVGLVLEAIERYEPQPQGPRRNPFSLVFVGPGEIPLGQRIHALDHRTLGRLELFLVPIGPGRDGRPRYEAVFN